MTARQIGPPQRMRVPRLADAIADHIRDAVLDGELADGERLPPLEALVEQFGVSAPTMREALRILEAEGMVVVQRGGIGGAIVRRPTAKTAAYNLALALRSQQTDMSDVTEAIVMLQPLCAGMCASRADRKSKVVRELRKLNKVARQLVEGDEVLFNDAMVEFHRSVVRLAGNEALELLSRALEHIAHSDLKTWVATHAAQGGYPPVAAREREIEYHERITDLIDQGDADAVARVMLEHIRDGADEAVAVVREGRVDPRTVRSSTARD
jgi:DNA-binding FadR family transcriptional regulator